MQHIYQDNCRGMSYYKKKYMIDKDIVIVETESDKKLSTRIEPFQNSEQKKTYLQNNLVKFAQKEKKS